MPVICCTRSVGRSFKSSLASWTEPVQATDRCEGGKLNYGRQTALLRTQSIGRKCQWEFTCVFIIQTASSVGHIMDSREGGSQVSIIAWKYPWICSINYGDHQLKSYSPASPTIIIIYITCIKETKALYRHPSSDRRQTYRERELK